MTTGRGSAVPSPELGAAELAAARMTMLQAVSALAAIGEVWAPAGGLVEDARMALAGEAGITSNRLRQLRAWGARWRALDPRLRALYHDHAPSSAAARAALWHALSDRSTARPSGMLRGVLGRLWRDRYGYPCPIDITPSAGA